MKARRSKNAARSVTSKAYGESAARESRAADASVDPSHSTDAPVAHCSCDVVGRGGKAAGVDPAGKERNLNRLRRIEGQVRGLARMVEEDRYCADILTQVASVQEALRSVGRELLHNHLKHCATIAIRAGGEEAEAMYAELIDLAYRSAR